jgi:hypothetical protein
MKTRHLILAAIAAVAGVLTLQPLADGASPTLRFVVVEGPTVSIPAQSVSDEKDYDVRCPKNYVATGPGVSLGTTQLVFADPDPGGRGYSFAFLNNSSAAASGVSASVVCMRGSGVRVRAASLNQEDRRRAVEQARRSLERR